jgi:hypothetical protein
VYHVTIYIASVIHFMRNGRCERSNAHHGLARVPTTVPTPSQPSSNLPPSTKRSELTHSLSEEDRARSSINTKTRFRRLQQSISPQT